MAITGKTNLMLKMLFLTFECTRHSLISSLSVKNIAGFARTITTTSKRYNKTAMNQRRTIKYGSATCI